MLAPMSQSDSTLDPREVARFRALAAKWWDPEGEFAPLHAIGPERTRFLREQLVRHFGLDGARRGRWKVCASRISAAAAASSASRWPGWAPT